MVNTPQNRGFHAFQSTNVGKIISYMYVVSRSPLEILQTSYFQEESDVYLPPWSQSWTPGQIGVTRHLDVAKKRLQYLCG